MQQMDQKQIGIGTLSKETGVNIGTIRYYEREGILPEATRGKGNQRRYRDEDIRRLGFIIRCRELGFTLKEITSLLGLVDGGAYSCAEIYKITSDHMSDVKRKLNDLKRIESALQIMAASCSRGDRPDCPIIDTLFDP